MGDRLKHLNYKRYAKNYSRYLNKSRTMLGARNVTDDYPANQFPKSICPFKKKAKIKSDYTYNTN